MPRHLLVLLAPVEEMEFLISMAVHVSFPFRAQASGHVGILWATRGLSVQAGAGSAPWARGAGGGQGVSWGHVSSLLGHTVGSPWALLLAERLVVMSKTSPGAQ